MTEDSDFNPFAGEKKGKEEISSATNFSDDILNINRRVKVLEENINNLRRKILVNEQNDLNRYKKNNLELKTIVLDINELKKSFENIKIGIKEIISELKGYAKKEEIDILKKYVEIWDPIRFVSVEQVEKIIDEKLKSVKLENGKIKN
ncbi:MAG: hypothetical protein KAU20_01185 [Nanoarchaeota archaeon]|nr:hypothetical protein [Nanoarchaeota archaeon]